MSRLPIFFASLMIVASLARAADTPAPPTNPTVLVLTFTPLADDTAKAWIGQAIQQNLQAELARQPAVRVVGTISITPAAQPAANPPPIDDQAACDLAKTQAANVVILGSYQIVDTNLRVTGKVLNVATGQTLGFLKANGSQRQLLTLEDSLVDQSFQILALAPATAPATDAPPATATATARPYYDDQQPAAEPPLEPQAGPTIYEPVESYPSTYSYYRPASYYNNYTPAYSYYPSYTSDYFFYPYSSFNYGYYPYSCFGAYGYDPYFYTPGFSFYFSSFWHRPPYYYHGNYYRRDRDDYRNRDRDHSSRLDPVPPRRPRLSDPAHPPKGGLGPRIDSTPRGSNPRLTPLAPRRSTPVAEVRPGPVRDTRPARDLAPAPRADSRATPTPTRAAQPNRTPVEARKAPATVRPIAPAPEPRRDTPVTARAPEPRRDAPVTNRAPQPRREASPSVRAPEPRRESPSPSYRAPEPRRESPPVRVAEPRRESPPPSYRAPEPRRESPPVRVAEPRRESPSPSYRAPEPRRESPPPSRSGDSSPRSRR